MVKSFKCMAAQLLNLFCLNPTPMTDRQTRDRQKWAKLVKAVLVGSVELWKKISLEGMAGLLEIGSNSGQSFGSRYRLSQWFRELPTSFPSSFGHSGSSKKDLGSIVVQNHAMPHPRWSVVIEPPKGG